MIDTKELRRGNLIYDNQGQIHKVDSITEKGVNVSFEGETLDLSVDIKPIPLTEDWLKKRFKFSVIKKTITKSFVKHDLVIRINDDGEFVTFVYSPNVIKLKFVHQLQNLFFALRGKELNVNQ